LISRNWEAFFWQILEIWPKWGNLAKSFAKFQEMSLKSRNEIKIARASGKECGLLLFAAQDEAEKKRQLILPERKKSAY